MTTRRPFAIGLLALAASIPATLHAEEGWDWMVAPYLWAPSIKADLNESQPPVENDQAFVDWIDKLEVALLGHVEGQGDRFGMFGDVIYLALGDSHHYPRVRTEGDLDSTIIELAAVLPLGEERFQGFDVFGGLRYFDVSASTEFDPVNDALPVVFRDHDDSYYDFMLGARYTAKLSDRWGLTLRGDGSTGDSDGSWSASINASYRMGNGSWVFGYRYMEVELPMGDSSLDLTLNGPQFGYAFRF
ncbi:hypothetical protein [Lysobacter niastensis]|uniref:Outer membrane protein beta-barrel domain-containing protein n=1 Tax=Lysobacter niastensis TaxID=380629 RepID=A0ABS0B3B4_9GAMM|nr:hypothetical protein [Lysobacter niastensis]MBF6022955.1 hypothetical protein [Lysobacter niastensis]